MAGMSWSEEEEQYFWLHIIPFSRRRRGLDLANPELSFRELAEKMRAAFAPNPRRQYTGLALEEHYYQNIEGNRISKHAHKWVKEYKALAKEYPALPAKATRATQAANAEVEPTHVATKAGAWSDWELGGDENADKRAAILKLAKPVDEEQEVRGQGTATDDDQLFAGPTDTDPGYDSDRTVTDVTDEIMSGTLEFDTKEATETATNQGGNNRTEDTADATAGAQKIAQDAITNSEDGSLVGKDIDGQQSEGERVRE